MTNPSSRSPLPVMKLRLRWLLEAGIRVETILDAGVQYGTPFLMEVFPDIRHLLFEPIDQYHASIQRAYASHQQELFPVALSDTDGFAWSVGYCADGTGKVTNSRLSDAEIQVGSVPGLVSCREVRKTRLDTLMMSRHEAGPYLMKVDVDGAEMHVLRGSTNTLSQCSIVIVEAELSTICEKIVFMSNAGFDLVDIVDLCYYYNQLSQVDLIFVHREWKKQCPDLRPWQTKEFNWGAWASLSRNELFAEQLKR